MSLLLGVEINKAIQNKDILVEPFNANNVSINSIDVSLSNKLLTYQPFDLVKTEQGTRIYAIGPNPVLDMKKDNKTYEIIIPEEGLILDPSMLYLGSTNEKVGSFKYIPMYEGRSSMARLGIQSHLSAGFGDLGFQSFWTLEIRIIHPVKFYPNIRIGQVFFHKPDQEAIKFQNVYKGKYVDQVGPQKSQSFKDFK